MRFSTFPACIIAISISACSTGPYEPIVDGEKDVVYKNDLAECRQLSKEVEKTKDGVVGGAVAGGLIGAIDSHENAIAGAVIGGVVGSIEDGVKVKDQRDKIVFNCLKGRGHRVVG